MDESERCLGRDLPTSPAPKNMLSPHLRHIKSKKAAWLERYRARRQKQGEWGSGLDGGRSTNTRGSEDGNGQGAPDGGNVAEVRGSAEAAPAKRRVVLIVV